MRTKAKAWSLLAAVVLLVLVSRGDVVGEWAHGHATSRGLRSYQEDRVLVVPRIIRAGLDGRVGLFAVFDGHIGFQASEFLVKNFEEKLVHHLLEDVEEHKALDLYGIVLSWEEEAYLLREALVRTVLELNDEFLREAREHHIAAGSTACVVLVTEHHMVVANVGDSRAMVCVPENGKLSPMPLSSDHHPDLPEEKARIEAAGGVIEEGVINDHFPMSRAVGDLPMTRFGVVATPNTTLWKNDQNGYLVIASDGIYEGLDSGQVCDLILATEEEEEVTAGRGLAQIMADKVLKGASHSSTDNLSIVVVPLKQ